MKCELFIKVDKKHEVGDEHKSTGKAMKWKHHTKVSVSHEVQYLHRSVYES